MTIQELIDKYNNGQVQTLDAEVSYIMDDPSQGESAAYAFAFALEQHPGAGSQLANLAYNAIGNYKMANTIKQNQQAALAIELKKAQDQADRNAASAASQAIADAVLATNNADIATPVTDPLNPLILNPDRLSNPLGSTGVKNADGTEGYVFPEFVKNAKRVVATNKMIIFYLGLLLIGIYYVSKK